MLRPLTDDEKRTVLKQMVDATQEEIKRRQPEIQQVRGAAQTLFWEFVKQPTMHVEQAEMPAGMTQAPVEQVWSVTPEVTVE